MTEQVLSQFVKDNSTPESRLTCILRRWLQTNNYKQKNASETVRYAQPQLQAMLQVYIPPDIANIIWKYVQYDINIIMNRYTISLNITLDNNITIVAVSLCPLCSPQFDNASAWLTTKTMDDIVQSTRRASSELKKLIRCNVVKSPEIKMVDVQCDDILKSLGKLMLAYESRAKYTVQNFKCEGSEDNLTLMYKLLEDQLGIYKCIH
jgi:hypothetical protein